jgi:hypothetical protein
MATGGEYWAFTLLAYSSLASYQYRPVRFATTAGYCVLATADTDPICGIVQNNPAASEPAEIAFAGICKAVAGVADLNEGEILTANTSGVADTSTGEKRMVGLTIDANSAVGDIVRVLLNVGVV